MSNESPLYKLRRTKLIARANFPRENNHPRTDDIFREICGTVITQNNY